MEEKMHIDVRTIKSEETSEIFITATPCSNLPLKEQAEEIFSGIKNHLQKMEAWIFEERIFATEDALEIIGQVRKNAYDSLDDGVSPTCLIVPHGMYGEIAGVQVHAICSQQKLEIIRLDNSVLGRMFIQSGKKFIAFSNISDSEAGKAKAQARAMFEKAESALELIGCDMFSVVRTWIWIKNILNWYNDFNSVRTQFFTERGLIKENENIQIPASTGIGITPTGGAECSLDLFAVIGEQNSEKFLLKGGEQGAALEYGSAFSRASRTETPAGETIFISGTAAVGPEGETEHIGDIRGQINATFSHVLAILKDMDCSENDVVHMIAYCKTDEVEKVFSTVRPDLPWPWMTVISEICRDNLLFEIEVTACSRVHNQHS